MTSPTKNKDKSKKDARDIRAEALKIANSQHIDGQTREQTRLIATGIQRGMEQFLRQQNEKTRELDKRIKKVQRLAVSHQQPESPADAEVVAYTSINMSRLPWVLLIISWILFVAYVWWGSR